MERALSQSGDYDSTLTKTVGELRSLSANGDLVETEIMCQEFISTILQARPLERLPELAEALITLAEAVEKQGRDAGDLRQFASLLH